MSQLSSADTSTDATAEATTEGEPEVEVDERRQAVLDDAHRPGSATPSSARTSAPVTTSGSASSVRAWPEAAAEAKAMGFTFFDFLSAIDWLPSPFGRDMDAQEDLVTEGAPAKEPAPIEQGYAGGDTRFQVFARLYEHLHGHSASTSRPTCPTTTSASARGAPPSPGPTGTSARPTRCSASPSSATRNLIKLYLPLDFQGHPLRKDFPLLARRVRPWPGIVDVEPMPGTDDEGEGEAE